MNNEKQRLLLIVLFMFGWVLLLQSLGLLPTQKNKPADKAKAAVNKQEGPGPAAKNAELAKLAAKPGEEPDKTPKPDKAKPGPAKVELIDAKSLVLGSATDKSPGGYRLEARLDQKGAGVESLLSSRYDAEFEGRHNPHLPLQLIRRDPVWPASLSLTLGPDPMANERNQARAEAPEALVDEAEQAKRLVESEDLMSDVLWDVIRDESGQVVHQISGVDPASGKTVEGQEARFRTTASSGVIVTKVFRLWQDMNGLELELRFESPDKDRSFTYNLLGPHGIPIEGEWYTGTFREVFFGTYRRTGDNQGNIKIDAYTADGVVKATATGKEIESQSLPLWLTGVENQYFTTFMAPYPSPAGDQERFDRKTMALLLHKDEKAPQKSDVGVRMSSKTLAVGPNTPVVHTYRIYAGPKIADELTPYGGSALASYRKSYIPGASWIARYAIAPALSFTHDVTVWIMRPFGRPEGNWGIAIILLTILVKLMMFPLGRKQALMAQKTQTLQPFLKEIQEKYKDDKEKQTRETMALYKRHGVNPVSGCLPALIQLPIFVGLWQALNTSVALRHSPFLWINDLAAPDMLARFPMEIPFLGNWFNLLPLLVVGLMLFQTKLFSPPATTPEQEMQQKTMKFMMIFMAAMFYKVPSGLGIYFITSSLWSIGERLLLPKITHATPPKGDEEVDTGGARGKGGPGKGGPGGNGPVPQKKPPGAFGQFMEKILEEARKDPTYRKIVDDKDGKDRKADSDDRRDRGKPRARPGRK